MPNDREITEMLAKSFHLKLDSQAQSDVEQNIENSDETAKFAQLSRMIQDSVADMVVATQNGDIDIAPGLSEAAKSRLRDSVAKAKSQTMSGTLLSDVTPTLPESSEGDSRNAESRFTLLRKIGEGGLGTVWLARDEDLKRTVAIKEILPDKAESPKHLQRFQREAAITGLLEHPNVVPLYMYGVNSRTGKPFYAMRFLGKQTLGDAIEEYHARRAAGHAESIDLHRLLTVFLDICQAIAYAHSRGVVHRDLKPDNVALDNFGQVIVLDWGIAKLLADGELAIKASLGPTSLDDSVVTRTMVGEVVGSPLYMAPEQARGELDDVDERTDVYGLGAILFSILSGDAPHKNSTRNAGSDGVRKILQAIALGEIPPPHTINPEVPRDLEEICLRAMSVQRFARHGSAKELADDVEHWMAGQAEQRKKYEAMRFDGYNMRHHVDSAVRDFATNVRFMSTLPPIQGLIDSAADQDQEGETVWRERLSTIFRGLLKSNSGFTAVTYSRVIEGVNHELVRVEKPSHESESRAIPKSRLREEPLSTFEAAVMGKKPDEVNVAISNCTADSTSRNLVLRLEAGVPVFDREEEPFGMVVIEGDFNRLISSQANHRTRTPNRILITCNDGYVILEDAEKALGVVGTPISELVPSWPEIQSELDLNSEYQDSARKIFATRIELVPRQTSLSLVLLSDD